MPERALEALRAAASGDERSAQLDNSSRKCRRTPGHLE